MINIPLSVVSVWESQGDRKIVSYCHRIPARTLSDDDISLNEDEQKIILGFKICLEDSCILYLLFICSSRFCIIIALFRGYFSIP